MNATLSTACHDHYDTLECKCTKRENAQITKAELAEGVGGTLLIVGLGVAVWLRSLILDEVYAFIGQSPDQPYGFEAIGYLTALIGVVCAAIGMGLTMFLGTRRNNGVLTTRVALRACYVIASCVALSFLAAHVLAVYL